MRILVTRPEPDATAQARVLAELGHRALLSPLFEIEFTQAAPLPRDGMQAIIATSRNALRAMKKNASLESLLGLPLFAVGCATARLAAEFGFENIHAGEGTAERLAPLIMADCHPEDGTLLHPAGERLAWDLKGVLEANGFTVLQPAVYRSNAVASLSDSVIAAIKNGEVGGVILMSPEAARIYVQRIRDAGLETEARNLTNFCLSGAVAKPLESLPGAHVSVAVQPTQDDLLALIAPEAAN